MSKAQALLFVRRYEEANAAFDQALTLDPGNAGTWIQKSATFLASGLFEDALDASERALTLDVDLASAWRCKSLALASLNRPQEALDAVDRGLARAVSPELLIARTSPLLLLKRYDETLADCDRALALNGTHGKA